MVIRFCLLVLFIGTGFWIRVMVNLVIAYDISYGYWLLVMVIGYGYWLLVMVMVIG